MSLSKIKMTEHSRTDLKAPKHSGEVMKSERKYRFINEAAQ